MNKKIQILELIKKVLIEPKEGKIYYTMEEKREMALRGEDVPICAYGSTSDMVGITSPRHIPNEHIKKLKFKI